MDIETLFSGTRWEIITLLSKQPLSPNEIAQELNTTPANISQQLRLLELGNLIKSEKTKNSEKGKPRIVYSLASDLSYLILASDNFAQKKLLHVMPYHNFMLNSWFIDDIETHETLGKLYFRIEPYLKEILAVFAIQSRKELEVLIVCENQKILSKTLSDEKKVKLTIVGESELKNYSGKQMIALYNPNKLARANKGVR
ncbi:MAG: ArsR family transcriptional regulator [archaeon]